VLLAIIYEDSVAVLGVVIALLAQWITYITGDITYDGNRWDSRRFNFGIFGSFTNYKNHQYINRLNRLIKK